MSWFSRAFVVRAKGVRRGEQFVGNAEQGVRATGDSSNSVTSAFNTSGMSSVQRIRHVPNASDA